MRFLAEYLPFLNSCNVFIKLEKSDTVSSIRSENKKICLEINTKGSDKNPLIISDDCTEYKINGIEPIYTAAIISNDGNSENIFTEQTNPIDKMSLEVIQQKMTLNFIISSDICFKTREILKFERQDNWVSFRAPTLTKSSVINSILANLSTDFGNLLVNYQKEKTLTNTSDGNLSPINANDISQSRPIIDSDDKSSIAPELKEEDPYEHCEMTKDSGKIVKQSLINNCGTLNYSGKDGKFVESVEDKVVGRNVSLRCHGCRNIFTCMLTLRKMKPLPSVDWDAASEDWFCHLHSDDKKKLKEFSFIPALDECFYNEVSYIFNADILNQSEGINQNTTVGEKICCKLSETDENRMETSANGSNESKNCNGLSETDENMVTSTKASNESKNCSGLSSEPDENSKIETSTNASNERKNIKEFEDKYVSCNHCLTNIGTYMKGKKAIKIWSTDIEIIENNEVIYSVNPLNLLHDLIRNLEYDSFGINPRVVLKAQKCNVNHYLFIAPMDTSLTILADDDFHGVLNGTKETDKSCNLAASSLTKLETESVMESSTNQITTISPVKKLKTDNHSSSSSPNSFVILEHQESSYKNNISPMGENVRNSIENLSNSAENLSNSAENPSNPVENSSNSIIAKGLSESSTKIEQVSSIKVAKVLFSHKIGDDEESGLWIDDLNVHVIPCGYNLVASVEFALLQSNEMLPPGLLKGDVDLKVGYILYPL